MPRLRGRQKHRVDSVALVPPGCVGIAHNLADTLVQQEWLNGAKEGKDQLEAHRGVSWDQRPVKAGHPDLEEPGLNDSFLRDAVLVFELLRRGLFCAVELQD